MSQTIFVKKARRELKLHGTADGETKGRTAGSWVHDLCALEKVVTLCDFCKPKFNPGRLGYIKEKEYPVVQATCDGYNL